MDISQFPYCFMGSASQKKNIHKFLYDNMATMY